MMQLIDCFQHQGWQISFASPATIGQHKVDLTKQGVTEHTIELNSSSFDAFIQEMQPNIVIFDRFMMEEQFSWRVEKNCPDACRILDTEDLHFLRQARHQAIKQQRDISKTDLYSELAKREVASILRCDLSLMISSFEIELLVNQFNVPQQLLLNIPFMLKEVSSEQIVTQLPSFEQRRHFISIGNFRHAPNWDAVLQLKTRIWPLIKKALPEAELHIYGAYPPPKATALTNMSDGFLVKGWAEDAQRVMKSARVCLAPLRFGAGLKGKLTEAMTCGTPSITTNIGAEGMHDDLPWNGVIEDDPAKFAEAAIDLYQDKQKWTEHQLKGFNIINRLYSKEVHVKNLLQRLEALQQNLESERQANFIGAMLRHHSMKSTQYMSQWIEAKNKLITLTQE